MTGAQSVTRADLLRASVGVCAVGGVFMFVWAGVSEAGRPLVLAIAFWAVGCVLSLGINNDAGPVDEVGSDAAGGREPGHRRAVGPAEGPGDVGPGDRTSADALETLRERYAQGEMTEAEFERRVERLLDTGGADPDDAALLALRERYARGELSDEQFDRKLDRLTETRTIEDATDAYELGESTED